MKEKKSFFERLTGSVNVDDKNQRPDIKLEDSKDRAKGWLASDDEGQLTVDVFQTPDEIIVQSTVAGVKPDDLDVSITQDMVTVKGERRQEHEESGENYFHKELYWGKFSRSVMLPQEVDSEKAEASLKNGLLTIRLPKIDRERVQKVHIKKE